MSNKPNLWYNLNMSDSDMQVYRQWIRGDWVDLPGESVTIECTIDDMTGLPMVDNYGDIDVAFEAGSLEIAFEGRSSPELVAFLDLLRVPEFEPNGREPALSDDHESPLTGREPGLSTNHRKKK